MLIMSFTKLNCVIPLKVIFLSIAESFLLIDDTKLHAEYSESGACRVDVQKRWRSSKNWRFLEAGRESQTSKLPEIRPSFCNHFVRKISLRCWSDYRLQFRCTLWRRLRRGRSCVLPMDGADTTQSMFRCLHRRRCPARSGQSPLRTACPEPLRNV